MPDTDLRALVDAVSGWVETHGKPTRGIVNGYIAVDVWQYDDDVVRISRHRGSKAMEIKRKENQNPVLMINEDGSLLRYHGEFSLVREHLRQLVGRVEAP